MKKIRWGILGTGTIAHKFAADLKYVEGAELTAAGSRSLQKAQSFCEDFNIPFSFGSYKELAESNVVDIIYIATPHNLHQENTLLCLNNSKAVLCEKPFALNAKQATEMIELSRQKKLFLMDALWTKLLPHYQKMMEMVKTGVLGDIQVVLANFGFQANADPASRLLNPESGGGSLMDIGIYNVFTALDVLGKPDEINVSIVAAEQGVDEQCGIIFKYDNGSMASLFSTLSADLATEVEICGTLGRLKLTTPFYEPSSTLEYYANGEKNIIGVEQNAGFGYQFEARHATECLQNGLTESPILTHAGSLLLMQTLDRIRNLSGIVFPGE
ncbi:gfo/Idh/MocA family oxidoreductase [Chryseobacterium elymi]|uniref:Gfo/Idh/MocA family oxidoreductase n=1 Tax=Chryseobacterium elymi TaxID=395936 RepID=A0A3D9DMJ8_9FLAO|nr:Gfo/Idh/MocA family oxidoreductase [Chryseobacterium elymi]REC79244.1 gfo/Idh/MocA family oxidoreductase [Chryseobacterium elymi]